MSDEPENKLELLEQDIAKLFHQGPKKADRWDILWSAIKSLFSFVILFCIFFITINFSAYTQKIKYFANNIIYGQGISQVDQQKFTLLEPIEKEKQYSNIITTNIPNNENLDAYLLKNIQNNHLVIPKISVNAPITWDSPINRILDDLRNGVSHYGGTALPGESGNVFITGHSSNFWWDPGKYKQVFVLLDKLTEGDRIYLTYQNQPYVYKVTSIKIVKPSQIEVLDPTDQSIVSLMTCTPVGTTINRLLVQAIQIYPTTIKKNDKRPVLPDYLPAIR